MFEIGSEFWTESRETGNGLKSLIPNNQNIIYTLCGRTALDIILVDIIRRGNDFRVYMPSYCCHTMIEPFLRNRIHVDFYDVTLTEEGLKCRYEDNRCEIVFLIDYFGFLSNETLEFAKKERNEGKIIIYDATHSMFCSCIDYSIFDYVFGSFRKWLGLNAGFAIKRNEWESIPNLTQNKAYVTMRNKAFDMKANFICDPVSVDKNNFLLMFQSAEEMLENNYQCFAPDERSTRIMNTADIERIRVKRRKNARMLIDGLINNKKIHMPYKTVESRECPLFVPITIDSGRDTVRRYLIDNSIYLPVHWPISGLHNLKDDTKEVYDKELSCVCDQRYTEEDIQHIIEKIEEALYTTTD